jgi:hypothetical protein
MNDEYGFRLRDLATQAVRDMSMICLDDEAALLLAERFALGCDVEVWEGDRFLGLVASSGPKWPAPTPPAGSAPPALTIAELASPPAKRFKPFWAGAWRRGAEQA